MSLFNINWLQVAKDITPSKLRSSSFTKFLRSLLHPLNQKSSENISFDNEIRKRSKFNSQIIVLRAALNNIFNISIAPFILIGSVNNKGVFIFNESEGSPEFIYNEIEGNPLYIFNAAETVNDITENVDFVVQVPDTISTPELLSRVEAETRLYKLSGKRFTVKEYTP